MNIIKYPGKNIWPDLVKRPVMDLSILIKEVEPICTAVKKQGDAAVKKYEYKFSKVQVESFRVSDKEIEDSEQALSADVRQAILIAASNIRRFHEAQKEEPLIVETMPGITCWKKMTPIERVGLYIPGGTAPLLSTVLMLGIPATIAGCSSIALCTPPAYNGTVHPTILFAAKETGIRNIFKAGGAQAIAALAYGTESIPAVYKIFGPGNQYVTAAKQFVSMQGIAIDMPAGPSEVVVAADIATDPAVAAADLISQAEHGPDSQVVLCTDAEETIARITHQIDAQVTRLPRASIAAQALEHSYALCFHSKTEIIDFVNAYCPEHLILLFPDAAQYAGLIANAGSVFLGLYAPESAGDYASGTNHTLPTNGYARSFSGITVNSFMKSITFQQMSCVGLDRIAPTIMTLARAEQLEGHSSAVSIRLERYKQGIDHGS